MYQNTREHSDHHPTSGEKNPCIHPLYRLLVTIGALVAIPASLAILPQRARTTHDLTHAFAEELKEKWSQTFTSEHLAELKKQLPRISPLRPLTEPMHAELNALKDHLEGMMHADGELAPWASLVCGYFAQMGCGATQDFESAKAYYEQALGYGGIAGAYASLTLSGLHLLGLGVEQDLARAQAYWNQAMQMGVPPSTADHLLVAAAYQYGIGVEQNSQLAKKHYAQAIDGITLSSQPIPGALHLTLGYLYQFGCCVDQDFEQAQKHYEKAAQFSGSTAAAANLALGRMHQHGVGVLQDLDRAKHYYTAAGDIGGDMGQFAAQLLSKLA